MVDIVQGAYIRHQLLNRVAYIHRRAEALEWVSYNRPVLNLAELLPEITSEEGRNALARYEKMLSGVGIDIHKERLWGTVGNVGWAGNEVQTDEMLEALDLRALARAAFTPLFAGGIAAMVAYPYKPENGEMEDRIDVLTGYLEPLYAEDNAAYVGSLLQVVRELDGKSWKVHEYHYGLQERRTWRNLSDPNNYTNTRPTATEPLKYPPRFVTIQVDEGGLPVGEVMEGLGLLRDDLAKQAKKYRLEEDFSFPVMALYGNFKKVDRMGPNLVLEGNQGDVAERLAPGDLSVMQAEHDNLLERIRKRFAGRVGFGGTSRPAEGTIVEANQLSLSAYEDYARVLSTLLTQVVADYAALSSKKSPPVQVSPNRAAYKAQVMADMLQLYKDGLISLDMALGEIRNYYNFTEDQVKEFIASKSTATSGDIARLLGGGQ